MPGLPTVLSPDTDHRFRVVTGLCHDDPTDPLLAKSEQHLGGSSEDRLWTSVGLDEAQLGQCGSVGAVSGLAASLSRRPTV
jgi:hypothetical protein